AAFLADLNPEIWNPIFDPYSYTNDFSFPNKGVAFQDANSLLQYRYSAASPPGFASGNYNNLASLPPAADVAGIDEYSNGSQVDSGLGFAGADNPTHYFTPQDLFDPLKTSAGFVNRLLLNTVSNPNASTNRYTFYRMQAQI